MVAALLLVVLAVDGGEPLKDTWDFDGLPARITARAVTKDQVSSLAMKQLGLQLEGALQLKVSAHPNTVGGITLRVEDPGDANSKCDLYANVDGAGLRFTDSRCSFPAFSGNLRTTATCRRISGTAKRVGEGVALDARFPDCNASPMGLPLSLSGEVSAR
ncbi:MAG: hypothetical protein U0228_30640 [Myxococcaceae bacterium]